MMLEINSNLDYKAFLNELNRGEYDETIFEYFKTFHEIAGPEVESRPEIYVIVNLTNDKGQKRTLESNENFMEDARELTDNQIVDLYDFLEIKKRVRKVYRELNK